MKSWHAHLLRTEVMVFLLGLAIFAEIAFLAAVFVVLPESGFLALIAPDALTRSANAARQDTQSPVLITNPLLTKAAQLKANDMATKSYFAHTSPAGVTPWYWLDQVGYRYSSAGENLAVDFIDSSDVHQAWMNSPGHRANILNAGYTEIGIATATGIYKGHETVFAVQFFGKPRNTTSDSGSASRIAKQSDVDIRGNPVFSFSVAQAEESGAAATLAASPRKVTNYGFAVVGILIVLALGLTILIRMELPHPQKAILPMATIAIIISFILINHKIALAGLQIL
ncbi:MAG: CAP domain-containing protein [Patescibacteria group bacterium]